MGHIYQADGLGRPTIICELSTTALQGVSPTSCGTTISGTGFVTTYANSLESTTITQGSQTRTFTYDGLGRLTAKTEPEVPGNSGGPSTTYAYSSNATGQVVTRTTLAANQTSLTQTTTATTQYDSLGRPVSITYNDGITPTKTFTYDAATSGSTYTVGYAKGRMTSASTGSSGATTQFSYDSMGRVQGTQQCIPGWCSNSSLNMTRTYGYDWEGNPATEQYSTPLGMVSLGYGVNLAGQLTSVTGGQDSSLTSLFSATTLSAYGPTAASLGNGVSTALSYDVFGHRSGLGLTLGSTPIYAYTATWQGPRLASSADSVNGTGTYGYDDFSRLQTATVTMGTSTANLSWAYDRYGNRLSQSATGSYPGTLNQPSFTVSTGSNRITSTGYTYDAAGNLSSDGVNSYTYDAEGNVVAVSGGMSAAYTYDALNQRVLTTTGGSTRAYGFNAAGQRATVWDGSGNLVSAQYYAGSQPLAYYLASDGHVHFQHQDWIGTERFRTSYTGSVEGSFTSLPFGDSTATSSGSDTDVYHYAGLDKDSTDLQHAGARELSANQGRWLRPDPYDGSYDITDPQSFNRYAYVGNNPLVFLDPSGMDGNLVPCPPDQNARGGLFKANDITLCYDDGSSVTLSTGTIFNDQYGNAYIVTDAGTLDGAFDSTTVSACQGSEGCYTSFVFVTSATSIPTVTPWYHSCTAQAIFDGAGTTLLDAIGILPEGGTISAAFSAWHGAAGVSNGIKIQQRVSFAAGIVSTAAATHDLQGPQESNLSTTITGLQAAAGGFGIAKGLIEDIPVAGQAIAIGSTALDLVSIGVKVAKCP